MKLIILLTALVIIGVVSSASSDGKKRVQSMYKMTESPANRQGGVKGGRTTQRPLRKGEYVCGSRICKLRPGEVPKGCEGGECQYNVGYQHRRK